MKRNIYDIIPREGYSLTETIEIIEEATKKIELYVGVSIYKDDLYRMELPMGVICLQEEQIKKLPKEIFYTIKLERHEGGY